MESMWLLLTCLAIPAVLTREIILPPSLELQDGSHSLASDGKGGPFFADQTYAGLTTFANLPWVHCLSSEKEVSPFGQCPVAS